MTSTDSSHWTAEQDERSQTGGGGKLGHEPGPRMATDLSADF